MRSSRAAPSPSRRPAEISETALLERVAVAGHDGYDRVVFQFRNGLPGYRVEYADPPLREDGSGNVVDLEGNAFLVVRMEPASGFDLTVPEGKLIYTGPRRIAGDGTTVVRELVRTGDFEAVLTWAVGPRSARPVPRAHARRPGSDRRRLRGALRLIFDG